MMATERQTYNGWTNYETWCVKLWIDNDQGSQEYWRGEAKTCLDHAMPSKLLTRSEDASRQLAIRLKTEHIDGVPEGCLEGTVWGDLLTAALGSVNWDEIAASMVDGLYDDYYGEDE